ncbi:hypothetical protein BJ166DRAFT_514865 [Pestalotiopsis sp. NC0098]|nr:hypothetical protein BJ166DRAFT_514865 [Pestalotiopsis sp. NC0098]
METSAPKRRKTSSLPSSGSDGAAPSSGEAVRRSTRRRTPASASPSEAVLSRNTRHESLMSGSPGAGSDQGDDQAVTAQLEGASENRPASDPPGSDVVLGPSVREPQSPIRQTVGGMRGRPRRSTHRPSPRPLPPPSIQEEELLDPFKGRVLRRSPPRGVLPVQEPEEPELPPTPTEKGLSKPDTINTSPLGIHNTPSKRPRRSRALADKLRSGSSPLKQPPLRPIDFDPPGKETSARTQSRISRTRSKASTPQRETFPQTSKLPLRSRSNDRIETETEKSRAQAPSSKPHPARHVKASDPFAEKTATRDSLLEEIKGLQADLRVLRNENDSLHAAQQRGLAARTSKTVQDPDALFELLLRHAQPLEDEQPADESETWLKAALDPMSFLPFGGQLAVLPSPFQPTDQAEQVPHASSYPLPMSLEEERPYLQIFTPLRFTSTTTTVPRGPGDGAADLMQQHHISISSIPEGLFAAQIDMLVDTRTLSVSELAVPRMEAAAANELGAFVEKVLGHNASPISTCKRNIAVLTWAMAEWTRLASKRARLWHQIAKELGHRQGIMDCARNLRRGKRRRRQHKAATNNELVDSDEEDRDDGREVQIPKSHLISGLGRTSCDLVLGLEGHGGVELRVDWKITFDWTGEGQSTIKLQVQTPGKWRAKDNRGRLAEMPTMFDKLVQDGGDPMGALRTVVALLSEDSRE